MTIEEFLLARIADVEKELDRAPMTTRQWILINQVLANQRFIVEWHKNFPVLIETPPQMKMDVNPLSSDYYIMQMEQQLVWLTQEKYREKFGNEPPTAPLLKEMASLYSHHPDWQEDWRVFCSNPECPQAGQCNGACAANF